MRIELSEALGVASLFFVCGQCSLFLPTSIAVYE